MKTSKIIYYIVTGLFTVLMSFSIGMYLFNHEEISKVFVSLGYPSYIVYPLALAKALGLVALWFMSKKAIVEWAYAGFFFNALLAMFAHIMIGDGEHMGAVMALVLLLTSYVFSKKIKTA